MADPSRSRDCAPDVRGTPPLPGDGSYLTQAESDARYVNESGDVVEGVLSYAPGVQAVMPSDLVTLADLEEIPKGDTGERGPMGYTWTITQPDDPGDPANFTQPWPYNVPLWVDTDAPDAPGNPITQAEADTRYVNVDGDSMLGPLVLHADPVEPLAAATKRYVDDSVEVEVAVQPDSPTDDSILLWVDTDDPGALDALAGEVTALRAEVQELRAIVEASHA